MNCLWDLLGRQNARINLTLVNLTLEANEKSLIPFLRYLPFTLYIV